MYTYTGLKIVESVYCTKKNGLNFPYSKNRSKRQLKKLLKRFGSQVRYSPTSYIIKDTLIIHPELLKKLRYQLEYFKHTRDLQPKGTWFEEASSVPENCFAGTYDKI